MTSIIRSTRSTRSTRLLTAVAGSALTATALVAAPAVQAAPAKPVTLDTGYTCTTAIGDKSVDVTVKLSLPATVKKGKAVKASTVKLTVVLPEDLVGGLRFLGVTELSGSATGAKYSVGATKVPLTNATIPPTAVPESGTMTLHATGKAGGFTIKKPGTYAVKIPASFAFNAKNQDGEAVPGSPMPCSVTSGEPTKIGSIKVTK